MKKNMIYFVCTENENKILKICRQYKRADVFMSMHANTWIQGLNPDVHPCAYGFKLGDILPNVF